ncbi:MAG TPA: hypothetical protein VL202_00400 [Pararhizobium sp.]|uniref:hypothetical protein n=1 Tax=Pararhizobium sp. TaxID=1977563 RepID=UPI002C967BB8|nr:hypothetical protein [Pararhizobium sp.]HTM94891.1 hypothetical protein [Croceibacterium sp.]HTO29630.1 hypothetical protein [Pararhizobium sp.]
MTCHLTMPGCISAPQVFPSTLDVRLDGRGRVFLRGIEAAGGRSFLGIADDLPAARICLRQGLVTADPSDSRCLSISAKGRAYLARLRGAA